MAGQDFNFICVSQVSDSVQAAPALALARDRARQLFNLGDAGQCFGAGRACLSLATQRAYGLFCLFEVV